MTRFIIQTQNIIVEELHRLLSRQILIISAYTLNFLDFSRVTKSKSYCEEKKTKFIFTNLRNGTQFSCCRSLRVSTFFYITVFIFSQYTLWAKIWLSDKLCIVCVYYIRIIYKWIYALRHVIRILANYRHILQHTVT